MIARARLVLWAVRAGLVTRRHLRRHGLRGLAVPPCPPLGLEHERAVELTLGRMRVRCLVRSLVLQRFLLDHGQPVPLVVGATSPRVGFSAHAWLDRPGETSGGHAELVRLEPGWSLP